MVTSWTVIVVVPLAILVNGHKVDAKRVDLWYATYGINMLTFDDPLSILFVLVEWAITPMFVQLANALQYFKKLHYIIVDEAHLLLFDFRLVMKHLLPLWGVDC